MGTVSYYGTHRIQLGKFQNSMINYNDFEVEDWVGDAAFQEWIYRGEGSQFWQEFLRENPHHADNMSQARCILLSIRGKEEMLPAPLAGAQVSKILELVDQSGHKPVLNVWWRRTWFQVAASLLLVAAIGWGTAQLGRSRVEKDGFRTAGGESAAPAMNEEINSSDTSRIVHLADGSTVVLKKNSRIRFPKIFDPTKREVFLLGEAFFEVTKNPSQPFFVYANELVTKVLGTSFNVRAYQEDKVVSVQVKTGKVSVFAKNTPEARELSSGGRSLKGMILTPNQQADLGRTNLEIVRTVVAKPELLSIPAKNRNFIFKRTRVTEVFHLLETAYGVNIIFDEELMANCTVTASLGDEPLFDKLDMIAAVMEASYESIDGQIVFSTNGCN